MKFLDWFRPRPRGGELPPLPGDLGWWVVEGLRENRRDGETFRIFEAVVAPDEDRALNRVCEADEDANGEQMRIALARGEITHEWEWVSPNEFVRPLSITPVATEAEVAELDPELLEMLRAQAFYTDGLAEDPRLVISGGAYTLDDR